MRLELHPGRHGDDHRRRPLDDGGRVFCPHASADTNVTSHGQHEQELEHRPEGRENKK